MARVITEHELFDESDALLAAVERGETIIITRQGPSGGGAVFDHWKTPPGVPADEIRAAFARLPPMDYASLRADIDEFFGDDDRIRDEDYE